MSRISGAFFFEKGPPELTTQNLSGGLAVTDTASFAIYRRESLFSSTLLTGSLLFLLSATAVFVYGRY